MVKIAILGGGPAGLSAAFHLVRVPGAHHEITVYQMGWRLGGKGASGRNLAHGGRIEEHGVHLFGSFYPNTWRMLRTCYQELYGDEAQAVMERQFLPNSLCLDTIKTGNLWHQEVDYFPSTDDLPWIEVDQADLFSFQFFRTAPLKIYSWLDYWWTRERDRFGIEDQRVEGAMTGLGEATRGVLDFLESAVRLGGPWQQVIDRLSDVAGRVRDYFPDLSDTALMMKAVVAGIIDGRLWNGLDQLDGLSHRQWLLEAGGLEPEVADSAAVKAIPNICFQYPGGDTARGPSMSAAAFLTFVLRSLGSPGPFGCFFRWGTGESAMLPIYDFLRGRGVQFEFFSRVVDVIPEGDLIGGVVIEKQATPLAAPYDPLLVMPGSQGCQPSLGNFTWPVETPLERLAPIDGNPDLESWFGRRAAVGEIALRRGIEFDYLVLAIPIGAHEVSCPSLVRSERIDTRTGRNWSEMVAGLETIPTQAVQMWMKRSPSDLGLPVGEMRDGERLMGASWADPLNGWTDFSDLIEEEEWADPKPRTLLYFCGPLLHEDYDPADGGFPGRQLAQVVANVDSWLGEIRGLLPASTPDFRRELHVCEPDIDPMSCQYLRANVEPHERYVLSAPNHLQFRRLAWHSGYENMALAGDWIFTGLNIASFEAAVMSGGLASHALTGFPSVDEITGYQFGRQSDSDAHLPDGAVPLIS